MSEVAENNVAGVNGVGLMFCSLDASSAGTESEVGRTFSHIMFEGSSGHNPLLLKAWAARFLDTVFSYASLKTLANERLVMIST